jgi:hypothetical protein
MGAHNILIDSMHCRAICDEIGDRLRLILDRDVTGLPVRLQLLLAQLAAQDLVTVPSTMPGIDETVRQPERAEAASGLLQVA